MRFTSSLLISSPTIRRVSWRLRFSLARKCDDCVFEFFNRIGQEQPSADCSRFCDRARPNKAVCSGAIRSVSVCYSRTSIPRGGRTGIARRPVAERPALETNLVVPELNRLPSERCGLQTFNVPLKRIGRLVVIPGHS